MLFVHDSVLFTLKKKWMFVRRFPLEQGSYQGYIYTTVEKLNERNSVPQGWLDFSVASRSFFISFTINNLTETVYLPSLGKHWIMRKFEEYIIKIGLKANLDRLVVMQAILMIWNLKRKQIVTCLFFFIKKKKRNLSSLWYCSKIWYLFC